MNLRRVYFGVEYLERPKGTPTEAEENEEQYQLKSFLNVIADSGVVEVYKLTRTELAYLNEKQQSLVYDTIVQIKEPDRPNKENIIKEIRDQLVDWDEQKKVRVRKVILQHKVEKFGVMAVKDM